MLFRFHDPDNPASLYVWGIQPARRKRRMLALARVFAGILILGLFFIYLLAKMWSVLDQFVLEQYFVILGSALRDYVAPITMITLFRSVLAPPIGSMNGSFVRDLYLSGAAPAQLLRAFGRPGILGAWVTLSIYLILSLPVLVYEISLAIKWAYDSHSLRMGLIIALANKFLVPALFSCYLLAATYLNQALGVLYEKRSRRIFGAVLLLITDPSLFVVATSRFFFEGLGGYLITFSLISLLMLPIRIYIVRLLWLRALRHFDEPG